MNSFKPPRRTVRQRHQPGQMNKLEEAYALMLDLEKMAGRIIDYEFEAVTLVLTKINRGVRYTPDFMVILPTHIRFVEVKGHWEEDARVKIKVAAEMFPWFEFVAVTREPKKLGGGWKREVFE